VGGLAVRDVGLVSDRWASGAPMVIHRSKRREQAVEEPWAAFANGPVYVERPPRADVPASVVLGRARALLGSEWRMMTQKCEHFVAFARGERVRSGQVRAHATGGAAAAGVGFAVASGLVSKLASAFVARLV